MTVRCIDVQHRISFSPKGAVTFHGHPGVSPASLATEYEMLTDKSKASGCVLVAFALVRAMDEHIADPFGELIEPYIANQTVKRLQRFKRVRDAEVDPFRCSIQKRYSLVLLEKAREALRSMSFRSTPHVGHDVHIDVTRRGTRVIGTKAATENKLKKKKVAMLEAWKTVIHAEISKSWCRVWLNGIAVVENRFVYEIMKQRSKTDIRVRFIQQSRGYTISYHEGDIHKGSDGKWRVIEPSVITLERPRNSLGLPV